MEVVYQAESHSMGWCLDCHNAPEKNLRPLEEVYNFSYNAEIYLANNPHLAQAGIKTTEDLGLKLKEEFMIKPKVTCATCHH